MLFYKGNRPSGSSSSGYSGLSLLLLLGVSLSFLLYRLLLRLVLPLVYFRRYPIKLYYKVLHFRRILLSDTYSAYGLFDLLLGDILLVLYISSTRVETD